MTTRIEALQNAAAAFDAGAFERRLAGLVAIPSASQDPARAPALERYLQEGIGPWLDALGFHWELHPNPKPGAGPILLAERLEADELPTVITYGHGDTVRGMEAQWSAGRTPWELRHEPHPDLSLIHISEPTRPY